MERWKELLQIVPKEPAWQIDWNRIENSGLCTMIEKMKMIRQNPVWHGEGDVWTHTRMVCEELVSLPAYRRLEERRQEIVFAAALLHDIGKIPCTRWENGAWTSPNHTSVGSRMARELLWVEYGFCGTKELQQFRETVCSLIRYHSVPLHILDQERPEYRLIKVASQGELLADFSLELLYMLVEADIRGRITDSTEESLELVELCNNFAQETGCLKCSLPFPNSFSEYAYLDGRDILPGQELYDDTWGQVILMSGLPGTGKDTWIEKYYGDHPMVSLDEIRKQMKISPTDNQGAVVNAARDLAREYLRKKIPFVWNATNTTPLIRQKQIRLFTDYHASVRIVYLETEWEEQMRRNRKRVDEVPEAVICHMLSNMTVPERFEAHSVEWNCN